MRRKFKALDCCCCGGGMSMGLYRAGWDVTGLDIVHHECYPFPMLLKDFRRLTYEDFEQYDYIHLSPPCQGYSKASAGWRARGRQYSDLYPAAKRLAVVSGLPYTIENVPGSPAKGIRLYGGMFGLPILRERIFESNIPLTCDLDRKNNDHIITVAGSHGSLDWREAMGIDFKMPPELVKEAVPPAYGEYIGTQVMAWVMKNGNRLDYEKPADYEHQAVY